MKGILTVAVDMIERAPPDMVSVLEHFLHQGTLLSRHRNRSQNQIVYTVDHPDFDVEDARYELAVTHIRDPAAFYNSGYHLAGLYRVDEAGKVITVKVYDA